MCDHDHEDPPPSTLAALVDNHRAFLAFVERRVGSRDVAEEILQSALAKSVAKLDGVRESVIGWFYQVLRNAIIDHRRRAAVAERRLDEYAAAVIDERDDELRGVVCTCVARLAQTLKPEYADVLQQVEVEGLSVKAYAERHGISASNAGVRVFRAREALHKQVLKSCGTCAEHGCLDCTCAM